MANFLTPHSVDLKGNSDTLSDISETGTATSECTSGWGSKEDLHDIAAKIGLDDVNDLYQQRFRIDRKKLEHMLMGDHEAPEPAETFFDKIMEDTNTFINWPSRLKIGAKSKKDPHVKIAGRHEDVQTAKERIMNILDTRCNRVTLKMDVSYTDHSHIIGKEGLTIKRVMEETRCHVHFPDSNRSNPNEKSNQVSIAGDIDGAERARSRVRNLTPLILSFELPVLNSNYPVSPNANTPYVLKVQQQYNVQVMFRTRPKLHATLVMVKGSEWEIQQLKQATCILMEYMCDNLSNQIPIQMSLEISPHHHAIVIGRNHSNLKAIIQNTGTQIMFPDAQDPNISSLKKSNVTIIGNMHNVYMARQQLMGSLPLVLIFDLPEESVYMLEPEYLSSIQSSLDVTIHTRHNAKHNKICCIIKGIERYATNIYEARNRVLGIKEPGIIADIPTSYFISPPGGHTESLPAINVQPSSPLVSSTMWQPFNQQAPFVGMVQQPQFLFESSMHTSMGTSGYSSLDPFSSSTASLDRSRNGSSYSSISRNSPVSSSVASPTNIPLSNYRTTQNDTVSELSGECVNSNYYDTNQNDVRSDYDEKRIAGMKAMQNRHISGYRVPTNTWSGYGISYTSPGSLQTTERNDEIWKQEKKSFPATSTLNSSNILESTPAAVLSQITQSMWKDLPTMLTSMGLEKYIGIFASNEIDLITFPSLSEHELIELGVTAFGARRKMVLIISEINKRASPFLAAPGAERKNSASSTNSSSSSRNNWL